MNSEFELIIKTVKNIKLTEDEKFSMRQNILNERLNYFPSPYQYVESSYFMPARFKFVPAFAMILIVVLAGSTSAFAEKAIPGDFFYGVKTLVNEPVAGIFAFTKEEKIEWQERLVERRLAEAQKLVSKNSLNENTRVYLENKIKNQVNQFSTNANELALQKKETANSSGLNIRLQASLKAYENVLTTLSDNIETDASTKQETKKLLAVLAKSQDRVRDDQKNIELDVEVDSVVVLAKKDTALNLLNSTKLLYQNKKVNLSANIQNKINNKLAEVETELGDGQAFFSSSDYANAADKFRSAIGSANSAKLLILSNTIKGDIEDEAGIDREDSEDIEDNSDEDNLNPSRLESDKSTSKNPLKELRPRIDREQD